MGFRGLGEGAPDQLVRSSAGEEIVAEALDEGFVADEDAGFDVLGVGGFGEVGGGDYGDVPAQRSRTLRAGWPVPELFRIGRAGCGRGRGAVCRASVCLRSCGKIGG